MSTSRAVPDKKKTRRHGTAVGVTVTAPIIVPGAAAEAPAPPPSGVLSPTPRGPPAEPSSASQPPALRRRADHGSSGRGSGRAAEHSPKKKKTLSVSSPTTSTTTASHSRRGSATSATGSISSATTGETWDESIPKDPKEMDMKPLLDSLRSLHSLDHDAALIAFKEQSPKSDQTDPEEQIWDRNHALKDYQLTKYWQFICLTSMWVYYGVVMAVFVTWVVPLEAVRLAPTWQAVGSFCCHSPGPHDSPVVIVLKLMIQYYVVPGIRISMR